MDADTETYCIIHEKTAGTPWNPPPAYSIEPDARSRLYDPTSPDDPLLPIPAPRLYAYHLPDLPARDPNRFQKSGLSHDAPDTETPPDAAPVSTDLDLGKSLIQLAGFQQEPATANLEQVPDRLEPDFSGSDSSETGFVVRPIPESVWESLPAGCLTRMFEFPSVREEYTRSWEQPPAPQQRDASPRLALEDILDLALLNSRAYQAQKENLYRAALRLSLERYDYLLKFSTSGNGSGAFYSHDRNRGITNNRLAIPTTITGDKVLATGGDLLARFANDVVLTFNGPDGFAADVGSELLLDISQSVLQRDIVFERLTQAERDVVYAARDFARFRKQFFRDLTVQYYSLILTYRGIEIDAQDYFSNLRAYEQGYAEYRA
ncbi:MAG: hypothetical protein JW829_02795, partial [Pirellulales bacterium]|nr:hypothetical protein [Pirellulales bacterium]